MSQALSVALPEGNFVSAVIRHLCEHATVRGRSWSTVMPLARAWQSGACSGASAHQASAQLEALLCAVLCGGSDGADAALAAWQLARRVSLPQWGLVGYGLMTATNAWSAIEFDACVQSLRSTGLIVAQTAREVPWAVAHPAPDGLGAVLWAFVLGCRQVLLEGAGGRVGDWACVTLPCAFDEGLESACRAAGVPVRFGATRYEERFFASILARSNPGSSPLVHQLATDGLGQPAGDLAERSVGDDAMLAALKALIRADLDAGLQPTLPSLAPRLQGVTGFVSLGVRQIQRRLAGHQTGFRSLLAEVRQSRALEHLRYSNRPLADIAAEAGYAELSSFHRAVRRWTGDTPMAYRLGWKAQAFQDA